MEIRPLRIGLALSLALLPACSSSLPEPPGGPVPSGETIEVPYPPPPARVETVPEKKLPGQVWIDGRWEWEGKAWKWREGQWMTPPPNAYFTPWSTKRRADGQLLFVRAAWRDKNGRPLNPTTESESEICAPLVPAPEASAR